MARLIVWLAFTNAWSPTGSPGSRTIRTGHNGSGNSVNGFNSGVADSSADRSVVAGIANTDVMPFASTSRRTASTRPAASITGDPLAACRRSPSTRRNRSRPAGVRTPDRTATVWICGPSRSRPPLTSSRSPQS